MAKPKRIQLSRAKGFNLQAASQAANGLPAVNVARPSRWGNPFAARQIETKRPKGKSWATVDFEEGDNVVLAASEKAATEYAVDWYRDYIDTDHEHIRKELRGKNLACWCKPGARCHADVLLEVANG